MVVGLIPRWGNSVTGIQAHVSVAPNHVLIFIFSYLMMISLAKPVYVHCSAFIFDLRPSLSQCGGAHRPQRCSCSVQFTALM